LFWLEFLSANKERDGPKPRFYDIGTAVKLIEQSRKLLQKYFGYSSFKAGQAKVIGAL